MATVIAIAVYPTSLAGTRLRAWQFSQELMHHGHAFEIWSFFDEKDADRWLGRRHLDRAYAFLRGMRRVPSLLRLIRSADIAVVLRQAIPLGPAALEWMVARRCKLVWDVDDAVWETVHSPTVGRVPQWIRATGKKYDWICQRADQVWAGNESVADWCRARTSDVRVVPTVLPVPADRPVPPRSRTVGWIGSLSTGPFLEKILPAIRAVEPAPAVMVVGAAGIDVSREGLTIVAEKWSKGAEQWALSQMRVGLYPVDRSHPLAEGKSGFKAVLYMSQGVPVVVTPTRSNTTIVRDRLEGIHAETLDDWQGAVQLLLDDDEMWERCSVAAHRRARDEYSLERWAPIVASYVDELAGQ